MQESPDVRSVDTLKLLIRILNSLHDECISRDLRSGSAFLICIHYFNLGNIHSFTVKFFFFNKTLKTRRNDSHLSDFTIRRTIQQKLTFFFFSHSVIIYLSCYFCFCKRFGISCSVCLMEITEPSVLPCQHVFCLPCLQRCIQPHRHSCPKCRRELPPEFRPTVSQTIKWVQKDCSAK